MLILVILWHKYVQWRAWQPDIIMRNMFHNSQLFALVLNMDRVMFITNKKADSQRWRSINLAVMCFMFAPSLHKLHKINAQWEGYVCPSANLPNYRLQWILVKFGTGRTLKFNMAVFWVIAPYSLVEVYRRFRGACCLHHQGDGRCDDGGSKHL
jgi:hypothetical protein